MRYTYKVSETINKEVDSGRLHLEILNSKISFSVAGVVSTNEKLSIEFVTKLSKNDKIILDAIVKDHQGYPDNAPQVLETVMLVPDKTEIISKVDWQTLGGIVMHSQIFGYPLDEIVGQVTGLVRTNGMGLHITIIEHNIKKDRMLIEPCYEQMDTKNTWQPFAATTNLQLSPGLFSYEILAKKNDAENAWLKNSTLSLIRIPK